jgi:hypothetical protein
MAGKQTVGRTEASESVRWCRKCGNPDQDLSLLAMARAVPGSVGYYKAMSGWSPEPCDCAEPRWEDENDA